MTGSKLADLEKLGQDLTQGITKALKEHGIGHADPAFDVVRLMNNLLLRLATDMNAMRKEIDALSGTAKRG